MGKMQRPQRAHTFALLLPLPPRKTFSKLLVDIFSTVVLLSAVQTTMPRGKEKALFASLWVSVRTFPQP